MRDIPSPPPSLCVLDLLLCLPSSEVLGEENLSSFPADDFSRTEKGRDGGTGGAGMGRRREDRGEMEGRGKGVYSQTRLIRTPFNFFGIWEFGKFAMKIEPRSVKLEKSDRWNLAIYPEFDCSYFNSAPDSFLSL